MTAPSFSAYDLPSSLSVVVHDTGVTFHEVYGDGTEFVVALGSETGQRDVLTLSLLGEDGISLHAPNKVDLFSQPSRRAWARDLNRRGIADTETGLRLADVMAEALIAVRRERLA